jgi:TonB family protein
MLKYFSMSLGVHAVALTAAVVTVSHAPEAGLDGPPQGTVITVRYLGKVPAQVVEHETSFLPNGSGPLEKKMKPVEKRKTPANPPREQATDAKVPGKGGQTNPVAGLRCPAPPYPRAAKRARAEGAVQLSIRINASGRVEKATLLKSSGRRDFDRAALDTIKRSWRYRPATKWGQPVTSSEVVEIKFRLD